MLFEKIPVVFGCGTADCTAVLNGMLKAKQCYDSLLHDLNDILVSKLKDMFDTRHKEKALCRISLVSIVRDWCDTLNPQVFEQLFQDGTEKMLSLFKSAGSDETELVSRLGKLATDLRIEDWDADTQKVALAQIIKWKDTAEQFQEQPEQSNVVQTSNYQLIYADDDGNVVTKRFNRVETTPRGQLLRNMIEDALSGMGQAISEQEKRQILMDALKKLC